jgi:type I restriction enzyme, R subunit
MTKKLNEDTLTEQPVIEWLKDVGYDHEFGPDLAPAGPLQERNSFREVLLLSRLKRSLRRINPDVSDKAIEGAISKLIEVESPNLEIVNKEVYNLLTQGARVEEKNKEGEKRGVIVKFFDFANPTNNEFLALNQFAVQGFEKVRRPDVVLFINGIPIAVFELKSPKSESGTIRSAYEQLQKYKKEIPELFKYNQVLVISDLLQARHGTISSPWEWFSLWRENEEDKKNKKGISELETLTNGIFHKTRFLDIVHNFIVFEADSEKDVSKFTKKMCLYHQYFGVNKAVDRTLSATSPNSNNKGKIGVFWHTQGAGKSLSMIFYTSKIRQLEQLKNPTFLFLTDRNDLDNQLYKTFLRTGYPTAKQAESIEDLKQKLQVPAGGIIFTTIQKFFDKEKYPLLSERKNIIVVSDEAHRSEYAKLAGNVRFALPNASFMGITGTPISLKDRDTRLVFGEHISTYRIDQGVADKAIVPIYYESRFVPLEISRKDLDEIYDELTSGLDFDEKERAKRKWANLEQAIGAEGRMQKVAQDIVEHFNGRGQKGKAMVVTMSRRIAAKMYELISQIPNAPEAAAVISGSEEFEAKIQGEKDSVNLEKRFKNPEDPLKIAIVCDMWLTGFDVPHLHTMYIDKPLKNHTLIQAIARVNRKYKDKQGGLIVDYIGIAQDLKKSLSIYSSDVQQSSLIPIKEAIEKMMEKYDVVKSYFNGLECAGWKKISAGERGKIFSQAVDMVLTNPQSGILDEKRKERFLKEATKLFQLFALVSPHKEAHEVRNEVEFFQAVKRAIEKRASTSGLQFDPNIDSTVKELISKSIEAEGVIDIFQMHGKEKPEISIFDEKFIEEVKKMRFKNLAIEVLRKLLNDEIKIRIKTNEIRYRSLLDLLEQTIEDYENNIINSSKVIERLLELAKEVKKVEKAGESLGLNKEEMAFYDALSRGKKYINNNEQLKKIVKELVKMIKRDAGVDWTNNEQIKARIRANVRILLLRNNVPPAEGEKILELIFKQASALYQDFASTVNS